MATATTQKQRRSKSDTSLEALAEHAREMANALFEVQCRTQNHAMKSCIQAEEDRPLTREERARDWARRPFYAYAVVNMCSSCRAYWYAELTAQSLHDLYCIEARTAAGTRSLGRAEAEMPCYPHPQAK